MSTLSMRHQQLAAVARTRRLFFISSVAGFVSLVGVCVAVLPWHLLSSTGQIVAFSLLAFTSFVWIALPIAAERSVEVRRRLNSAWWFLLVAAVLHAGMASWLSASVFQNAKHTESTCDASRSWCVSPHTSASIALPVVSAILPICAIPLLILLSRSFRSLPQDLRYDSLMDDDVPPGWHVPPAALAPDSSASDSEDEYVGVVRSDKPSAGAWYEMGRQGASQMLPSRGRAGHPSWSEVRRARKERQLAKQGGR
ncbi:hypothetical protein JCM10207_001021 [Rhodosporidiobolus poonsookiae]